MTNKVAAALAALLAMGAPAHAQWTDHSSFTGCIYSTVVNNTPVVGNATSLFFHDDEYGQTGKLTKVNGMLSDVDITALGTNGTCLFVGYKNGKIDIVDIDNGSRTTIPELFNSKSYQQKKINAFCANGNKIYCAFASGVLELDLRKEEIRSTWPVTANGINVADVCVADGHIYAATAQGIYHADLSNNILENSKLWSLVEGVEGDVSILRKVPQGLVAVENGKTLWSVKGAQGNMLTKTAQTINGLAIDGQMVYATSDTCIVTWNSEMDTTGYVSTFTSANGSRLLGNVNLTSMAMAKDGRLVLSDNLGGMLVVDPRGRGQRYIPNGPVLNNHEDMVNSGSVIYATVASRGSDYNNNRNPLMVDLWQNGTWSTHANYECSDASLLAATRDNSGFVFVSSWGEGVAVLAPWGFVQFYAQHNSTLTDIFGGHGFTRVDAMTVDYDGNLVVEACSNTTGLHIMTPDGTWTATKYGPMRGGHSHKGMMCTTNNNCWIWSSKMNNPYAAIVNMNGTPTDESDDMYVGTRTLNEPQCKGSFKLMDASTNDNVGSMINTAAEDRNGQVWVGTDAGLLVCTNDASIFETGTVEMVRIRVPRNDGTDLADYLLDEMEINCIVVDGANRKWIATSSNGVYLVSEDGYETIHHFTAANSPLLSNDVTKIAIDPTNGEVFFGTPYGIQSFRGDATEPAKKMKKLTVYPNPASHSNSLGYVNITGAEFGSYIFITDVTGNRVFTAKSNGGLVRWDMKRPDGERVATGVYLVWCTNADGTSDAMGKILVTE